MDTFRFRLERILDWRRAQCDSEERKLKQLHRALEQADSALARLSARRTAAELEMRAMKSPSGRDLEAFAAFRLRLKTEERNLLRERQACEQRVAEQRKQWVEAQRRCRLLEKLKARRLADFEVGMDQELENHAAELYLLRWGR